MPSQAALVLAPHPDDEIFGCGGAIASHVLARVPVHVVILTDGAMFGDAAVRRQECRAAAQILGYGEPTFWHLPDRGLTYSEALVLRIVKEIVNLDVDLVYAPSPWEFHPDHRQTTMLAMEAVRRTKHQVRLAFYEVGAPLRPNMLLDITPFISIKEAAIRCFQSQLDQQDYLRHIRALNQFRTYTLPREVLAAEAYWMLTPAKLDQATKAGLLTLVSTGVSPETEALPRTVPLVSIMIRSMGRECLSAALDSVALQTYPHIEVVVVAARSNHPLLPKKCGPFPLRLLETASPLSRSQAANRALANATGDFLLFLDDDDWLMPEHIARLAHVLSCQPHTLAVYTGIILVDAMGRPLGQTFDLPFDSIRQLAGNLTPIHAVLFSAKVVEKGCRFDEAIDLYEDWDFWLRLTKLAPMVHLPGISGVYRIHESSGVHVSSGPAGEAAEIIYRKWASEWTPQQISLIMQRVWSYQELEGSLAHTRGQLLSTQATLTATKATLTSTQTTLTSTQTTLASTQAALDHNEKLQMQANQLMSSKIEELTGHLKREAQDRDALFRSRSWRVTRPLRWSANVMRASPAGWLARRIRQPSSGENINVQFSLLEMYRKAYTYWRKYGFTALITRSRAEIVRKVEQSTVSIPFIQPPRSAQSPSKVTQSRFEALTPLPTYLLAAPQHQRISVVTDSIARGSLFGGVGTALIFATLLANKLGADLRIITRTEPPKAGNIEHILSVYGLELEGEIQLKFSPISEQKSCIEFSDGELFITTSWWTTAATMASVPNNSIVYLLQEDERMFYPFGDDRLRCEGILRNRDIRFLINTKLLFDHLVTNGLPHIREQGMWFEPAFPTSVYKPGNKPANTKLKFAFYARPNNLRNLFYLGIQVIELAIAQQILDLDQWEIIFVGKDIPDIVLESGHVPTKFENLNWSDYAELAGTIDLGLSLMYTPHPSYPPLDLVASGAVVVTNRFANKQDLHRYSTNLICAEPELGALVSAIREGIALATNPVMREKNFKENGLCLDWNESFSEIIQNFDRNT